MAKVLVMAGGTGGHVIPALSVAEGLRAQGWEVHWLGTRQGLEASLVSKANFPISYISISGLIGKTWLKKWFVPFKLLYSFWQCVIIVLQQKPDMVIGFGGFVSGPGGIAAWVCRKPLMIHEQNAIPGFTNRCLAKIATCVMTGFPGVWAKNTRPVVFTGNPVREVLRDLPGPEERGVGQRGPLRILVLGGSLGARAINECLPEALKHCALEHPALVWHQVGKNNKQSVEKYYEKASVNARIDTFIEAMDEAYAWADLVICRAGAMTLSELACVGCASILIPFPFAAHDHQTGNAAYLVAKQAALLVQEKEAWVSLLSQKISQLNTDRLLLLSMAKQAKACGLPDACERVLRQCKESMNAKTNTHA